jgi:cytochrome c biogenesis protein CcmG/thiol:disulfide interchange protein DsbE
VRVLVVLLATVLLLSGCSSSTTVEKPAADALPDVTLASLEGGKPLDLGELEGPAVVNLWASWCGPCKRELPQYAAFAKKYAGKVDVVGVDFQETRPSAARDLARKSGVTYPLYEDPDGKLRAVGLPKLILVDKDHRVTYQEYVEVTSLAQLEKLVSKHLGVSAG